MWRGTVADLLPAPRGGRFLAAVRVVDYGGTTVGLAPRFVVGSSWRPDDSAAMESGVEMGPAFIDGEIEGVPGLVFNAPNRLYAGRGKKEPVAEIRHEDAEPGRFPLDD